MGNPLGNSEFVSPIEDHSERTQRSRTQLVLLPVEVLPWHTHFANRAVARNIAAVPRRLTPSPTGWASLHCKRSIFAQHARILFIPTRSASEDEACDPLAASLALRVSIWLRPKATLQSREVWQSRTHAEEREIARSHYYARTGINDSSWRPYGNGNRDGFGHAR